MSSEDTRILQFNQHQESDEAPFIIYADLECIIGKVVRCKNNPENSSTTKVSKHSIKTFNVNTITSFRNIENKHDVCRSKDCM